MATTEILPYAEEDGSNVLDQADYAALADRLTGFTAGLAKSSWFNKVWRQSSFIACGLANWIVSRDIDVPDDGDVPALVTKINNALIDLITEYLSSVDAVTGVAVSTDGTFAANSDGLLPTQKATKTYVDSKTIFTKYFESSPVAISDTLITYTHSLGGIPKMFAVIAVCTSASNGYAVGDEILYSANIPGNAGDGFGGWGANATNVFMRARNAIKLRDLTTGDSVDGDPTKWNLILRAWR